MHARQYDSKCSLHHVKPCRTLPTKYYRRLSEPVDLHAPSKDQNVLDYTEPYVPKPSHENYDSSHFRCSTSRLYEHHTEPCAHTVLQDGIDPTVFDQSPNKKNMAEEQSTSKCDSTRQRSKLVLKEAAPRASNCGPY